MCSDRELVFFESEKWTLGAYHLTNAGNKWSAMHNILCQYSTESDLFYDFMLFKANILFLYTVNIY